MRRALALFLLFLLSPAVLAATLTWSPVTADILGNTELGTVTYRIESRRFQSPANDADPWTVVGTTTQTGFPLPTPSARQEYRVLAIDAAGNVSDPSVSVSARPETPANPKVDR